MATTPNYGWVTPAPTDFVTDLPADFETFADAVDADLSGLLGGTAGQVLFKDSSTDHDFSWGAVPAASPTFTGCMIFKGADQSISEGTFTAISFAETDYLDTDGFHDPVTNNTRITIPAGKGGKYLVFGQVFFADLSPSATQVRAILRLNGTNFSETRATTSPSRSAYYDHSIMTLAAGDYVELTAVTVGTGGTTIWGTTALSGVRGTRFGVQFLGA